MKAYKNVILVGEKSNFITMTFQNMNDTVKWMKYPSLMSAGQNNTTTINSLSIINRFMAEIYRDKQSNNETIVHYFIIPNNICKSIKSGTYKNWIKSGNTTTGKQLDKQELYQWTIFASLYKELFNEIDFKPLSYYNMKTFKYNYKQMMYTKELINSAYKILEENKEKSMANLLDEIL